MVRALAGLMALALAFVVLAGCSGDKPPAASGPSAFDDLGDGVEVTQTRGAIAGVVVDAAIRPVPNATIELVGKNVNTTSDAQGRFVFESLEPATYFLKASARRFETAQVSAEVVAGTPTTVKVLLAASTSAEPYHTVLNFHGHSDPWLGFVSFAVEVIAPGTLGCKCAFNITPDPDPVTFVFEAVGTTDIDYSQSPVYGNLYWEFIGDALGEHQEIHSAHGSFPVYETFDRKEFNNETRTWLARITPGQFVHASMDYDIYVTLWYHEAAPEGWSFVAGDT